MKSKSNVWMYGVVLACVLVVVVIFGLVCLQEIPFGEVQKKQVLLPTLTGWMFLVNSSNTQQPYLVVEFFDEINHRNNYNVLTEDQIKEITQLSNIYPIKQTKLTTEEVKSIVGNHFGVNTQNIKDPILIKHHFYCGEDIIECGELRPHYWIVPIEFATEKEFKWVAVNDMKGEVTTGGITEIPNDNESRNLLLEYMEINNINGEITGSFNVMYLIQDIDAWRQVKSNHEK